MDSITSLQCRKGRIALEWTQAELGEEAGVSLNTIVRFERGDLLASEASAAALRQAMEVAGVIFSGTDEVRLRAP